MNSRMSSKFVVRHRSAMDMRQRIIYFGGGALAISALTLGATVLFTDKEASAHVKVVPNESIETMISQVQVLVPGDTVRAGTKLNASAMKEVSFPRNEVPEGVFHKGEMQGDLYAKVDLNANQPVMRENVSNTPPLGNVADLVKPGYRAVTIEVDATSGVEGWATAGAHVDIVVTYLDGTDGKKKSQIAIEDAVVLSFNRNTERMAKDSSDARISSIATVTLSLPTLDAVKLHTARSMGKVSLMLRSVDDVKGVGHTEVTPEDFKTGSTKPQQQEAKNYRNVSGYASFVDKNGQTRELELKNGSLWSPNGMVPQDQK
ncbi:MAG: Flp pilus assembly protein CpaB [Bdellovibrionota bacterium]